VGEPPPADTRPSIEQQRRAASRLGGEAVKQAFDQAITRKRFAELVGIHVTTLRRWESSGVVTPAATDIVGIRTLVYTEEDVALGREIVDLLAKNPGTMSLVQAAAAARRSAAGRKGRKGRKGRARID
jgi:transcriptional regulator with XRE-family HTH domain